MSCYSYLKKYGKIKISKENREKVNKIAEILQNIRLKREPCWTPKEELKETIKQQINQLADSKEIAEETMNFLIKATSDFEAAHICDTISSLRFMFYRFEGQDLIIEDEYGIYNQHRAIDLFAKLIAEYIDSGKVAFVLYGENNDIYGYYIEKKENEPAQIFFTETVLYYKDSKNNFILLDFPDDYTVNKIKTIPSGQN